MVTWSWDGQVPSQSSSKHHQTDRARHTPYDCFPIVQLAFKATHMNYCLLHYLTELCMMPTSCISSISLFPSNPGSSGSNLSEEKCNVNASIESRFPVVLYSRRSGVCGGETCRKTNNLYDIQAQHISPFLTKNWVCGFVVLAHKHREGRSWQRFVCCGGWKNPTTTAFVFELLFGPLSCFHSSLFSLLSHTASGIHHHGIYPKIVTLIFRNKYCGAWSTNSHGALCALQFQQG